MGFCYLTDRKTNNGTQMGVYVGLQYRNGFMPKIPDHKPIWSEKVAYRARSYRSSVSRPAALPI